jgi:hypothetical protein
MNTTNALCFQEDAAPKDAEKKDDQEKDDKKKSDAEKKSEDGSEGSNKSDED